MQKTKEDKKSLNENAVEEMNISKLNKVSDSKGKKLTDDESKENQISIVKNINKEKFTKLPIYKEKSGIEIFLQILIFHILENIIKSERVKSICNKSIDEVNKNTILPSKNTSINKESDKEDLLNKSNIKNELNVNLPENMDIKTIRNKSCIVKLNSNLKKKNKEEDRYRGLARNLSGNKSFEAFANISIEKITKNNLYTNDVEIEEKKRDSKEKNLSSRNSSNRIIKSKNKNSEIDPVILSKLLKEVEEESKKRNFEKNEINNNDQNNDNKKNSVTTYKNFDNNNTKNCTIDVNDKNLIRISNILSNSKKFKEPKNNEVTNNNSNNVNDNSNVYIKDNIFAESIFILNQNGIYKNKNDNLSFENGISLNLVENKIRKSKNNDNSKPEILNTAENRLNKDKIFCKDIFKENEKVIDKKAKRNLSFTGNQIERKIDISNFNNKRNNNVSTKESLIQKNDKNSKKENGENLNTRKSIKNNYIEEQKKNDKEKIRKSAINNKNKNNLVDKKSHKENVDSSNILGKNQNKSLIEKNQDKEEPDEYNYFLDECIKKLEFDEMNKSTNKILINSTQKTNINYLLESNQKVNKAIKDNEMMVIIQNEKIIKDEIYIQKVTTYEEELLTKKSIKNIDDINFDNLSLNSISKENNLRNESIDIRYNNLIESNKNIINVNNNDNFTYVQRNKNNPNENEYDVLKSFSQSKIGNYTINSPSPISQIRSNFKDKKNNPYNKLQKNSFDSRESSPNDSNFNILKNQEIKSSNCENFIKKSDVTNKNTIKNNKAEQGDSSKILKLKTNKRLSSNNNPNIKLKNNLLT